eukprot:gene1371-4545_t
MQITADYEPQTAGYCSLLPRLEPMPAASPLLHQLSPLPPKVGNGTANNRYTSTDTRWQQQRSVVAATESTPQATPTVGIIFPPPEIRRWAFAERIRKEKEGDVKFNFLKPNNPYHAYFIHMVEEVKAGRATASLSSLTISEDAPQEEPKKALTEPKSFEFDHEPPPMSVQTLDILKLTAVFVAKNGNQFLQQLMQILMPKPEMLSELKTNTASFVNPLKRMQHVAAWETNLEEERQRRADEEEAERIARARIDWHDFVVVATIEFTSEDADLPAPVTPEQLGVRVIEMEQAEQQLIERLQRQPKPMDAPPPEDNEPKEKAKQEIEDEELAIDTNGMDTGEDEKPSISEVETKVEPKEKPSIENNVTESTSQEAIKIRPYDPKSKVRDQVQAKEEMLISPLTGELIPASRMQEHMRIGLLDPKWREEKERQELETRRRKDDWLRSSEQTMEHLKDIAARRTDIFGSGDIETEIGEKIGRDTEKEESKAKEKHAWDGVVSREPNALLQPDIAKHTEDIKRREEERLAAKIGQTITGSGLVTGPSTSAPDQPMRYESSSRPPVPSHHSIPQRSQPFQPQFHPPHGSHHMYPPPMFQHQHHRPHMHQGHPPPPHHHHHGHTPLQPPQQHQQKQHPQGLMPAPYAQPPQGQVPPQQQQQRQPHQHHQATSGGLAPPSHSRAPSALPNPPGPPLVPETQAAANTTALPVPATGPSQDEQEGNVPKRSKTEELKNTLMPEDQFLRTHTGDLTVSAEVSVDDASFALTAGTKVHVTLPYTAKVSDLKAKLQGSLNLPANKQKLVVNGVALANTKTLAFYNITPNTKVDVGLKTRGGKR